MTINFFWKKDDITYESINCLKYMDTYEYESICSEKGSEGLQIKGLRKSHGGESYGY